MDNFYQICMGSDYRLTEKVLLALRISNDKKIASEYREGKNYPGEAILKTNTVQDRYSYFSAGDSCCTSVVRAEFANTESPFLNNKILMPTAIPNGHFAFIIIPLKAMSRN